MTHKSSDLDGSVILITGAAQRIGATVTRKLHALGAKLIVHYRNSAEPAEGLRDELNALRNDSVQLAQGDLADAKQCRLVVDQAAACWGKLDTLINNASSFYPTPIGQASDDDWEQLIGSNVKGPFFLSQAAAPWLRKTKGCIVNMVDIHAERPMAGHAIYNIAKAGSAMLTKTLARELGPDIRVNGVAPGAILWPSSGLEDDIKDVILDRTALKRPGTPEDIAAAIIYLIRDAQYTTGQILAVDGGRSLNM